MGMRMPETCWAVFKWQVINLRSCCIWLVDSVERWILNFFGVGARRHRQTFHWQLQTPSDIPLTVTDTVRRSTDSYRHRQTFHWQLQTPSDIPLAVTDTVRHSTDSYSQQLGFPQSVNLLVLATQTQCLFVSSRNGNCEHYLDDVSFVSVPLPHLCTRCGLSPLPPPRPPCGTTPAHRWRNTHWPTYGRQLRRCTSRNRVEGVRFCNYCWLSSPPDGMLAFQFTAEHGRLVVPSALWSLG